MLTLAWDVDDVLNDLMRGWFDTIWRVENTSCDISYDDLSVNPPDSILGITRSQYLESLDLYRSGEGYGPSQPLKKVHDWFEKHGARFLHVAITAVPYWAVPISAHWVYTHFGAWIRSYHFVPSPRENCEIPTYDQSKGDVLARIGQVDYLIDDSETNLQSAERVGVKGILFPRPWNAASKRPIADVLNELAALAS